MKGIYEYSDQQIGLIVIGGSFAVAITFCLGLCMFLHSINRHRHRSGYNDRTRRAHSSSSDEPQHYGVGGGQQQQQQQQQHSGASGGKGSGGGTSYALIRQQSQSVVRGEHPIAFMLPTVPPSEPCSEFSDLESMATTYSTSPALSTATSATGYHPAWRRMRNVSPHQTVHHSRSSRSSGDGKSANRHHRRRQTIATRSYRYAPLVGGDSVRHKDGAGTEPEYGKQEEEEEIRGISRSLQLPSSPLYSYYPQLHRRHRQSRSATTSPRSFDVGSHVITESHMEGVHSNSPERQQQQQSDDAPKRGDISKGAIPKRRTRSEAGKDEESDLEDDDDNDDGGGDSTSLEEEERSVEGAEGLGVVRARFRVDWQNKIVISEIYLRGLKAELLLSDKVSVRIRVYPESTSVFKTGTMSVFDDKVLLLDPITLPVDNTADSPNHVVKLSVMQVSPSTSRRSSIEEKDPAADANVTTPVAKTAGTPIPSYGHGLLNLSLHLPLKDGSMLLETNILTKVSDQLNEIFSDQMEISLCYEASVGKLTLGIIQAKMTPLTSRRQHQLHGLEAMLYTKVTLYEGMRTMKAKKTRPVGLNDRPQFHETFNIVVPEDYLNRVSCLIGLHCKNKFGSKVTLGRFCLGSTSPGASSSASSASNPKKRGEIHWERMVANPGGTVIQWHYLE